MAGGSFSPSFGGAPPAHHGVLGEILHVLGQTGDDLYHAAIDSPAGLYHMGGMLVHHPLQLAKDIGTSTYQDFQHPLRHPGYTALDILGVGTGAGAILDRAAELGRVAAGSSRYASLAGDAANAGLATDASAVAPMSGGRQALAAFLHGSPESSRLMNVLENQPETKFGKATGSVYQSQPGRYYSRNLTIRSGQKLLDQAHMTFPNVRIPGVWQSQAGQIGKAQIAKARITMGLSRKDAALLVNRYGKATDAEHEAIAIIGRGTTVSDQSQFIKTLIEAKKVHGFALDRAKKWLARTEEAGKFLDEHQVTTEATHAPEGWGFGTKTPDSFMPGFKEPPMVEVHKGGSYTISKLKSPEDLKTAGATVNLHGYEELSRFLSNQRTKELVANGALTPEQAALRTVASKNVIEGHELPMSPKKILNEAKNYDNLGHHELATQKRAELNAWLERTNQQPISETSRVIDGILHTPDTITDPKLAEHLFRVPEKQDYATSLRGFLRPWKGGKPAEITGKPYTGNVLTRAGGPASNTAKLIAESHIEAQRFLYLTAVRAQLLAQAKTTPAGIPEKYRLPIVEDTWNGKLPPGFNFAGQKLMKGFGSQDEAEAAGRWYEPLRQLFFEPSAALNYARARGAPFQTVKDMERTPIPGIKWVDKRLLGGLDRQNPLWGAMENPVFRAGMKSVDIVNEAQKMMLLYAKPAYLFPNLLGNVGLMLIHQGFLSPVNLAKTLKIMFTGKGLDKEAVLNIRSGLGEGLTGSIEDKTLHGKIHALNTKAATAYGKVIDDPIRFSAFLHEARVAGFQKLSDVEKLATDPAYTAKFHEVLRRATDSMIDYEDLGPAEQSFMRRMVFFYPWLKGSTKYAYRLAINHPQAAYLTGQAGKSGDEFISSRLGAIPSFMEGVIPFGHGNETLNPQSAGVLGEFGDALANVRNMFGKNPNPDVSFMNNLSPADSFLYTLLTGNGGVGGKPGESHFGKAVRGLKSNEWFGTPNSFFEAMTGGPPRPNSLYPDSDPLHALSRVFALGGLTPRHTNDTYANYKAYQQAHPHG